MAKFVVAKIDFFTNELKQYVQVYDRTLEEVYALEYENEFNEATSQNIEEIKQEFFNADQMINIIMLR